MFIDPSTLGGWWGQYHTVHLLFPRIILVPIWSWVKISTSLTAKWARHLCYHDYLLWHCFLSLLNENIHVLLYNIIIYNIVLDFRLFNQWGRKIKGGGGFEKPWKHISLSTYLNLSIHTSIISPIHPPMYVCIYLSIHPSTLLHPKRDMQLTSTRF